MLPIGLAKISIFYFGEKGRLISNEIKLEHSDEVSQVLITTSGYQAPKLCMTYAFPAQSERANSECECECDWSGWMCFGGKWKYHFPRQPERAHLSHLWWAPVGDWHL